MLKYVAATIRDDICRFPILACCHFLTFGDTAAKKFKNSFQVPRFGDVLRLRNLLAEGDKPAELELRAADRCHAPVKILFIYEYRRLHV